MGCFAGCCRLHALAAVLVHNLLQRLKSNGGRVDFKEGLIARYAEL